MMTKTMPMRRPAIPRIHPARAMPAPCLGRPAAALRLMSRAATRPKMRARIDGTNTKHSTAPAMPSTSAAIAMPDRPAGGAPAGAPPYTGAPGYDGGGGGPGRPAGAYGLGGASDGPRSDAPRSDGCPSGDGGHDGGGGTSIVVTVIRSWGSVG